MQSTSDDGQERKRTGRRKRRCNECVWAHTRAQATRVLSVKRKNSALNEGREALPELVDNNKKRSVERQLHKIKLMESNILWWLCAITRETSDIV